MLSSKPAPTPEPIPATKDEAIPSPGAESIKFFVFYPNNYSGIDDDVDFAMKYLTNGLGAGKVEGGADYRIPYANADNGFGGYEIVGYRNLGELQEQLNDIMLRRRKEDVLDLPEKLYIDEYVEMTSKQAQIYKEVSMEIKANIDKIKMANNPLAELIRMRQATGYTGILSSTISESAKIDRLEELVEESVANNKKVVIFFAARR